MVNDNTIIIGGGLGGLTTAALLAKGGREVLLIEKKTYPFHRVCGEYVSNEVQGFLEKEGLFPGSLGPAKITRFRLSASNGRSVDTELDLGGFGISRYGFDNFLYQKAQALGAGFMLGTQVEQVVFDAKAERFELFLNHGEKVSCKNLVGAFGKRSKVDMALDRKFIRNRTPYIGVKYHIEGDFEDDLIALHNYNGGYCGINPIEDGKFCLCYLGNCQQLREFGNIPAMEENVLWQNPLLKDLFQRATFLYPKPEVINQINFFPKLPVDNHILMIGDAAGMITPLCGNGMAIAIHTGKLAAESLLNNSSRAAIENEYAGNWSRLFKRRLALGRAVQRLFGGRFASELAVSLFQKSPFLGKQIIKRTHGEVF